MPNLIASGRSLVVLLFAVLSATGCGAEDKEVWGRIGNKSMSRLEDTVAKQDQRLRQSMATLVGANTPAAEISLREQVQLRLRFDKALRDLTIEVIELEGVIELKGTVATDLQKTHAVELADQTVGVVRVEDRLEVMPPSADPPAKDP